MVPPSGSGHLFLGLYLSGDSQARQGDTIADKAFVDLKKPAHIFLPADVRDRAKVDSGNHYGPNALARPQEHHRDDIPDSTGSSVGNDAGSS